jgi:hypothetical protein
MYLRNPIQSQTYKDIAYKQVIGVTLDKNKKTLFEFGFCITINTSSQELFTEYT